MKVLLTTLTLVVLFVAGAAGTYFVMPMVAPDRVEHARQYLDSLDRAASMDSAAVAALAVHTPTPADTAMSAPRPSVADEAPAPPSDATPDPLTPTPDANLGGAVASPLAAPPRQVSVGPADARDPARLQEERRARASEMASVIAKLEDAELRALVAQLDPDVLTLLYREASARNKTRLLQAIPPEKAGPFVRTLITPTDK